MGCFIFEGGGVPAGPKMLRGEGGSVLVLFFLVFWFCPFRVLVLFFLKRFVRNSNTIRAGTTSQIGGVRG